MIGIQRKGYHGAEGKHIIVRLIKQDDQLGAR